MDSFNRWFLNPTKHQFFDFDGRATRQQFWMYFLWVVILSVVISIVAEISNLGDTLPNLFALALFIPQIAFGARRLHDIGKSGWWQLLNLIPIVGWIIVLVWLIREGVTGPNQYGPDPRASVSDMPTPMPMAQNPEQTVE